MNLEVDIAFHLSITDKDAVAATDGCSVTTFEVGYHYMMFHNMNASLSPLSDAAVCEVHAAASDSAARSCARSCNSAAAASSSAATSCAVV